MKYFAFLFLLPVVAFGSELEDKCNSLSPGQWAEITDYTGLNEAAIDTGSTKTIFVYGNHGVWDSQTGRAYFSGADHRGGVGPAYLIQFDSKSTPQKWTRLGATREKGSHARCENWFDPERRNYGFGYNYRSVNNIGSEQTIPRPPGDYSITGNKAYVYLPGVGLVQFQSGLSRIRLLADYTNASSSDWVLKVKLDEQFGVNKVIESDFFAVHDFKNNGVFFGGGIDSCYHAIYYMDSSFEVSKVTDFPGDCLTIAPSSTGIGGQEFFVDPATGDLIILADEGTIKGYSYNLTSNTWKPIDTPDFKYDTHGRHIVIPIPSLQCTLLAEHEHGDSKMWVYKHGEGGQSIPPVDPSPAAPQNLQAY